MSWLFPYTCPLCGQISAPVLCPKCAAEHPPELLVPPMLLDVNGRVLYRYAGEPDGAADLSAYTDAGAVSSYAEKAVAWCVAKGILTGKTDTTLAPRATATRAECAAMLQRFAELNKS